MDTIEINETNPFHARGYSIEQHVYLSPQAREKIITKKNLVYGPRHHILKNEKKRTVYVYKHEGDFYGQIDHKTETGHPIDTHIYLLKRRKTKQMNKSESILEQIADILDEKGMGGYHVHVLDDKGNVVSKAHASNAKQITSVLHRAAAHLKHPNQQLKAKVHDTFKNKDYKHTVGVNDKGMPEIGGADPSVYAKNEAVEVSEQQKHLELTAHKPNNTKTILKSKAANREEAVQLIKNAHEHALQSGEKYYHVTVHNTKTGESHSGKSYKTDWAKDV